MALSVQFNASLTIADSSGTGDCASVVQGDTGTTFTPAIGSPRQAAAAAIEMRSYEFASPSSYVALPLPVGLRGRLIYIRVKRGDAINVRLTHETTGAVVYPLASKGMLLFEPAATEGIESAEVQGEATIEWLITGDFG